MRIDLIRSFSNSSEENGDNEDWFHFQRKGKGQFGWTELHNHQVAVVLGEAGIGKTLEFQNEVERLQRDGKAAFFIPLNQLLDVDSWDMVVSHSQPPFKHWEKSTDVGYFFLDAVDEARLINHASFERALMVVGTALRSCLSRVIIAISSRVTDWAVEGVRDTVRQHLTTPITVAVNATVDVVEIADDVFSNSVAPTAADMDSVGAFTVSLDPLSRPEAKKLADAFDVQNSSEFWNAVEDGDYEFMATRPLDLGWMVAIWNEKNSLGTYSQLIDANVSNRLTDVNPNHQQAGVPLSPNMLRSGAEQLAAAAEFSGRPFVSTTENTRPNEIAPTSILSDWKRAEILCLLGSAVFDESTFGRIKFHHRSVREYLAASWIDQQLKIGLPLHRVLSLFRAAPFGTTVLIPSRRATLCWLTALNIAVREWVARKFPEMLLFEGDPEVWDLVTANLAFTAYIERVKEGLRTNWWNTESEFRRLTRRLPPGRVAEFLADQQPNSGVTYALLPLVKHGRLQDCGQVVFNIYGNPQTSPRERRLALITLAAIASSDQRASIKDTLLQGQFQSNELIVAALSVTDLQTFSVEELVQVFKASGPESEYGSGAMARAVKEDLLPETNVDSAELLLSAVIGALPKPKSGRRFNRFQGQGQSERAWLFHVLPNCTERLLSLLPPGSKQFPDVCIEAAEHVEVIRHSGFVEEEDLHNLHTVIVEMPALRWKIAQEIAQSEKIGHTTSRLIWGARCLVSFNSLDIPELTARANDSSAPPELRDTWFEIGASLALRELKGCSRRAAFSELLTGPDQESRVKHVNTLRSKWVDGVKQNRQYNKESRIHKSEKRKEHLCTLANLSRDIEHIKDGSSAGTLNFLISHSYHQSGRDSLTHVDFNTISRDFSSNIAEALALGLVDVWSKIVPPNPADYSDGQIPWDAITGLAGLHALLDGPTDISEFDDEDAVLAARLSVWEFDGPPSWFERLLRTHESAVLTALHPWIEAECIRSSEEPTRRTLDLALRSLAPVRGKLLQPVVQLVLRNRIPNKETLKAILHTLQEDGLLDATAVSVICQDKLEGSLNSEGLVSEVEWLRIWIQVDLEGAWMWFERHVANLGTNKSKQVYQLARTLIDKKWLPNPVADGDVTVIVLMYRLLTELLFQLSAQPANNEDEDFSSTIARLRDSIPQILVQVPGTVANRALVDLAAQETKLATKEWLTARVVAHAELEAEKLAQIEPIQLKTLSQPFGSEPKSEYELFQQVRGRLEEIRKLLEEGPFSDRHLFSVGIPEKHLQLWLAARLLDTTNRRFSVHREEEVDANKRTDVQLSCQHGNVCIEIKPLDRDRSYTATSLADTLRTQIVEQYLRGFNSSHGILLVLRLDNKKWKIPGEAKYGDFNRLLTYLRTQAEEIKRDNPGINELEVFGINCAG